jgi:hypothetical protein
MSTFKPTYLYIKQHSITKKLYFGKTTRDEKGLLEYKGSGSYWDKHIVKHGKRYVETIWYCLFNDKEDCENFAKVCSKLWNIVQSDDWANLTIEDGFAGIPKGTKIGPPSAESRLKNSLSHKGRPAHNKGKTQSAETSAKKSAALKGKNKGKKYGPQSPTLIAKRVNAMAENRIPISNEDKQDIAARFIAGETFNQIRQVHKHGTTTISDILKDNGINPKVRTCIHCGLIGSTANMHKYHNDKCKFKP